MPALEFLAEGVEQRSGISVIVESTLRERLPSLVEIAVYRFTQEALSNARRHAKARRILISLEREGRTLRCSVVDDGVGVDAVSLFVPSRNSGLGLFGTRERIEALGGTFRIGSPPSGGTHAVATIPVGA